MKNKKLKHVNKFDMFYTKKDQKQFKIHKFKTCSTIRLSEELWKNIKDGIYCQDVS